MNKEKCGLDLDGVVYDYIGEIDKFIKKKGYIINENRYDRGLNKDLVIDFVDKFKEIGLAKNIPEYEGVVKIINQLANKWDFYIITARTDSYNGYKDTIERVEESGIINKEIIFSRHKGISSKNLNLDFFIEDSYENALDIVNNSKATVYLINKKYNNEEAHSRIIRINSLEELL